MNKSLNKKGTWITWKNNTGYLKQKKYLNQGL